MAAALAAATLDKTVFLSCDTPWIGGQFSAQAIPPDEHPWIEFAGCTRSYRQFRNQVRRFYRDNYPLVHGSRIDPQLNPGEGNVSQLSHEPRISHHILKTMLSPFMSKGTINIQTEVVPVGAETDRDLIRAVVLRDKSQSEIVVEADYFLDATELGDLLPLADIAHVVGSEGRSATSEPHCPTDDADHRQQQAPSWSVAIDYRSDENHVIAQPSDYEFWRTYQADFWPGSQLGFDVPDIVTGETRKRPLFAGPRTTKFAFDLWHLRRVLYAGHFADGEHWNDISIANWPGMDYWLKPLITEDGHIDSEVKEEIRALALSYIYWLQTDAPRHDGGRGYPEIRLRPDVVGTDDGLAQHPYIRESRRIRATYTVTENHIGVAARNPLKQAETFHDSVGIGAYRMDLHPTPGGTGYIDLDTWPFQIPLGALIPIRVRNLLAAAKNIGTTHVSNGAYRVHPVEWNVGEAAGALAAYCIDTRSPPKQVRSNDRLLSRFQDVLSGSLGIPLAWPKYGALRPTDRVGWVPSDGHRS